MNLNELQLPKFLTEYYSSKYPALTPVQEKAVKAGLLEKKSLLVCAPTASGKTFIATMAICSQLCSQLYNQRLCPESCRSRQQEQRHCGKAMACSTADLAGVAPSGLPSRQLSEDLGQNRSQLEESGTGSKAIYLVPLKALAGEKFREYSTLFKGTKYKAAVSTGDIDSASSYLANYDLLILTTEKLDSLLRHKVSWLSQVKIVIADEIHLLNDPSRGPTLEVILTLLKTLIKPQIIGLSATIGNPKELAGWLGTELVQDNWRPVELRKGIHHKETEFYQPRISR